MFLNAGTGFHSNDARAVVTNPAIQPLARATGYEVGARTRQWDRVEFLVSLWSLNLQSELMFSGDAGTAEIRGATRRYGIELGNRTQLTAWLSFAGDLVGPRKGVGSLFLTRPDSVGYKTACLAVLASQPVTCPIMS